MYAVLVHTRSDNCAPAGTRPCSTFSLTCVASRSTACGSTMDRPRTFCARPCKRSASPSSTCCVRFLSVPALKRIALFRLSDMEKCLLGIKNDQSFSVQCTLSFRCQTSLFIAREYQVMFMFSSTVDKYGCTRCPAVMVGDAPSALPSAPAPAAATPNASIILKLPRKVRACVFQPLDTVHVEFFNNSFCSFLGCHIPIRHARVFSRQFVFDFLFFWSASTGIRGRRATTVIFVIDILVAVAGSIAAALCSRLCRVHAHRGAAVST
jgi:hypothetical protein